MLPLEQEIILRDLVAANKSRREICVHMKMDRNLIASVLETLKLTNARLELDGKRGRGELTVPLVELQQLLDAGGVIWASRKTGVSQNCIRNLIARKSLSAEHLGKIPTTTPTTQKDFKLIREYCLANLAKSYTEIAQALGVSYNRVEIACKGVRPTGSVVAAKNKAGVLPAFRHTEETKAKISEKRLAYLAKYPEMSPYRLMNKHRVTSYAEIYFRRALFGAYEPTVTLMRFELDFADVKNKIAVEIDGTQHIWDESYAEHDRKRDALSDKLGWTTVRIDWAYFQRLSPEARELVVHNQGNKDLKIGRRCML